MSNKIYHPKDYKIMWGDIELKGWSYKTEIVIKPDEGITLVNGSEVNYTPSSDNPIVGADISFTGESIEEDTKEE